MRIKKKQIENVLFILRLFFFFYCKCVRRSYSRIGKIKKCDLYVYRDLHYVILCVSGIWKFFWHNLAQNLFSLGFGLISQFMNSVSM